jgi:para-aminobenzoate synthetase / 4-amino-4-deoxychorismate lyase
MLAESTKDRAENLMILDMVRNDIGRIAELGSVRVPELFQIERYPTVYQMTSTVEGRTGASLGQIFAGLFPCASITGAPKVRTMQIIRELEPAPRGVYCGAIGYVAPGPRVRFNVAIRTAVVDKADGSVEYGVGGGIVWDSGPKSEYEECLAKARVLTHRRPEVELLETLLFEPQTGYVLLEGHLARLAESAEYFGFAYDPSAVTGALNNFAAGLCAPSRVRLRLDPSGCCTLEAAAAPKADAQRAWRLRLAPHPVDSGDVFLYHKTTNRLVYERAALDRGDADDVLLWNQRGEVTETLIANVVAELDGRLVTPPIECGLLPGVMRAELLAKGIIAEKVIRVPDLSRCAALFVINSVRGRLAAKVV